MEEQAERIVREVESIGGMTEAIVSGMPKLKIEECAARQQAMIDSGRRVIVGVNKYAPEGSEGGDVDVRRIDNTVVLEQQCAKLKALRAHRDGVAVDAALQALTEAARQRQVSANLLGLAVTAARARATVGEITAALEKVPGIGRVLTMRGLPFACVLTTMRTCVDSWVHMC